MDTSFPKAIQIQQSRAHKSTNKLNIILRRSNKALKYKERNASLMLVHLALIQENTSYKLRPSINDVQFQGHIPNIFKVLKDIQL